MRQTTFNSPPPYTGKRGQRFLTAGNKLVLDREARVSMRRESRILIAEGLEAAFEPQRDFAAEWEQAFSSMAYESSLDWYPCGCCECCGHRDTCSVLADWQALREEDDAMAVYFETGELVPVEFTAR
jgi:hypothetical protein